MAADVTPMSAAPRKIGLYDDLGANQTGAGRHVAYSRNAAQFTLYLTCMSRQGSAIFTCQHQHILGISAFQADLYPNARKRFDRSAKLVFDLVFADSPSLADGGSY